jgi:hypothetical protein
MNTVNSSTGFSPFQLHMGWSPRLILPLVPSISTNASREDNDALTFIERIDTNMKEAQDNLLTAKINQAKFANQHRSDEHISSPGSKVMLSTEHRRREYIQGKSGCVTKFIPRFDGPKMPEHLTLNRENTPE